MTLIRHLTHESHAHDFVVTKGTYGWDVREMEDLHVVRHVHHNDWHRVELDTLLFELRATDMKDVGWVED